MISVPFSLKIIDQNEEPVLVDTVTFTLRTETLRQQTKDGTGELIILTPTDVMQVELLIHQVAEGIAAGTLTGSLSYAGHYLNALCKFLFDKSINDLVI